MKRTPLKRGPAPARKTPLKPRRATSQAALKRQADQLWREVIRARDRVCQMCGRADGKLDAHHICLRRFTATRCDPANGVLLCFHCHEACHGDPVRALEFYQSRLGVDGYRVLRAVAFEGAKASASFWRARIADLETMKASLT